MSATVEAARLTTTRRGAVPRGTTAREKLEAYLAAEIGHLEP